MSSESIPKIPERPRRIKRPSDLDLSPETGMIETPTDQQGDTVPQPPTTRPHKSSSPDKSRALELNPLDTPSPQLRSSTTGQEEESEVPRPPATRPQKAKSSTPEKSRAVELNSTDTASSQLGSSTRGNEEVSDFPHPPATRPQRSKGSTPDEGRAVELNYTNTPSPQARSSTTGQEEESEVPRPPATRPQKAKSSTPEKSRAVELNSTDTASSQLGSSTRGNEEVSDVPRPPATRPQRSKGSTPDEGRAVELNSTDTPSSQLSSSTTGHEEEDEIPRPPAARPQNIRSASSIPTVPQTRPLLKSKTEGAIAEVEPRMPSMKPVKRTTTENLDFLVRNTSAQLKEMQQLISKPVNKNKLNDDQQGTSPPLEATTTDVHTQISTDKGDDESEQRAFVSQEKPFMKNNLQEEAGKPENQERTRLVGHQSQEQFSSESRKTEASLSTEENQNSSNEGRDFTSIVDEPEKMKKDNNAVVKTPSVSSDQGVKTELPATEVGWSAADNAESGIDVVTTPTETTLSSSDAPQSSNKISDVLPSKKRGGPPVPKKPSSRIAAFQQMLQKQQLEQLQGSIQQPVSHDSDTVGYSEAKFAHNPSAPSRSALSDGKTQFGRDLNALFSLPGMAPPDRVSASLDKRAANSSRNEETRGTTNRSLSDVRQNRARGPRGRKLPSKVASVEKVSNETINEIEVFHTWTTVSKNAAGEFALNGDEIDPQEYVPQEPSLVLPNENKAFNEGIQERRPSVFQEYPSEENAIESELKPVISESEYTEEGVLQDQSSKLQNRKTSYSDTRIEGQEDRDQGGTPICRVGTAEAIADRDQDGRAETLENFLEEQTEQNFRDDILADVSTLKDTPHGC